MNKNLTHIVLVIDRSGSMATCRQEAENGVNLFIEDQKKQPGEAAFSLVQFDTRIEWVHKNTNLKEVGHYSLIPGGMTALFDAIGSAINETGAYFGSLSEDQRPETVVVVIVTDGEENSSHEFKRSQIKDMIKLQQEVYNWQFTFLGANQDAFAEGAAIGIVPDSTANFSTKRAQETFQAVTQSLNTTRGAARLGKHAPVSYSTKQRKQMVEDDQ